MNVIVGKPYIVKVKGMYKTYSGYSDNQLDAKMYQGNFKNLSKKLQKEEGLKEEDIECLPFNLSVGFGTQS